VIAAIGLAGRPFARGPSALASRAGCRRLTTAHGALLGHITAVMSKRSTPAARRPADERELRPLPALAHVPHRGLGTASACAPRQDVRHKRANLLARCRSRPLISAGMPAASEYALGAPNSASLGTHGRIAIIVCDAA